MDEFLTSENIWILYVLVTIFLTFVLSYFSRILLNLLKYKLHKTQNLFDDAFMVAIYRPIRVTIWLVGISIVGEVISQQIESPILTSIPKICEVLFIIIVGWTLLRFIKNGAGAIVEHRKQKNEDIDFTTIGAITNLLKASIFITTSLIVLQALGYSINAVLTFGGISGIIVGFAAKDLLANFFGAMMIYWDRPFNIGDWVCSPDRDIEGTVEKIGWRMTTIRTFDKRPLYIPNSVFTQVAVENPSRMSHRRIYETIGIRYDDIAQMKSITDTVRNMLIAHEEIDNLQDTVVHFNALNASSCDFFVCAFTRTINWIKFHEIKQDVLLKIADIITEHNAEIAFPTQTLHITELEQQVKNG